MRRRALQSFINGYKKDHASKAQDDNSAWRKLTLRQVLSRAGRGKDHTGLKHEPHLTQLSRETLAEARELLMEAEPEFRVCRSFHDIWLLVTRITFDLDGYDEMAQYDTAMAIGAHLRLLPDRVYLHRGTRLGAKAMGLDVRKRESLELREFPQPLTDQLQPFEIEDFLCLYKGELTRLET